MASRALRVIAVAYQDINKMPSDIQEELEKDLNFVGLIGMIDPPREGVKEAVYTCKRAGIKTVMITGDHIATATAIAKELNILGSKDDSITGAELNKMTDEELRQRYKKIFCVCKSDPRA